MFRKYIVRVLLPAVCALACQSCGIYSFSGTSIQPDIQTFTIEYMQYKALWIWTVIW